MYRELAGHSFSNFASAGTNLRLDCPFGLMAFELLKPRTIDNRVRKPRKVDTIHTVNDAVWFEELPHDLRLLVQQSTTIEDLEPGQRLVCAGDAPSHWFGVLNGFVSPAGGEVDAARGLAPRAWFGEHFLLEQKCIDSTLIAAVPSRIARVPMGVFNQLTQNLGFCRFLMHIQAQRLAALRQRLVYPRRLTTNAKVGIRLAELFSPELLFDGEYRVDLSQSGLSAFLGLSRQRTNAALKRLEKLGEVHVEYGSLKILEPARLMRRALDGSIL